MVVIKVLGLAGMEELLCDPLWVQSYKDTPDGRGDLSLTTVREQALKFSNAGAALEFWRQQSKYVPLRPDGKPNRPLTAYTVEIENEAIHGG